VHGTGRAFDVSIYNFGAEEHNSAMWYVLNRIVSKYCELNLQRVIFDKKVWNANDGILSGPGGWRDLSASSADHRDHAHIEIAVASCESLSYEKVLDVMRESTFPTKVTAPTGVSRALPTAAITTITPTPAAPSLLITDTTGKWTPENLLSICGGTEATHSTFVVCGGKGGYAIHKISGALCAAGLAVDYGAIGKKFVSFVPYGRGYYWIADSGYSIGNSGPDTSSIRPSCVGSSAPYSGIYSPKSGKLIVVGADPAGQPEYCEFDAPSISGSAYEGPCC
jgi:hypothetical protein